MSLVRRRIFALLTTLLLMAGVSLFGSPSATSNHHLDASQHAIGHIATDHSDCDGSTKMVRDFCCVAACVPAALLPLATALGAVEWHLIALPSHEGRLLDGRAISPLPRPPQPVV